MLKGFGRSLQACRLAVVIALLLAAGRAFAQPGTLITTVNLPVPGNNVNVAVDCNGAIYFTNTGDKNLYAMDKNGVLLSTTAVTGFTESTICEMAWDNGRHVLWAAGLTSGGGHPNIYQINPTTGVATLMFNAASSTNCCTYVDGLAYDGTDDTLWVSTDISTTIEHYSASGAFINQITPKNATGGPLGSISGVTVGLGDLLYLGQDGLVQIVLVKKSDGSFLSSFASPGGTRDEGLECDAVNFAPKLALWSREYNSPGSMAAIELAPGTCACGGVVQPTPTPTATPTPTPIPAANTPTPTPTPTPPPTPSNLAGIPTVSGWGLMTLMVLIGIASIYRLRRI